MNKEHTKKICGEFPEFCYRAFNREEYAKQFLDNGSFRLGCRYNYRDIENKARQDPTEGRGYTKEPGIVTTLWVSPNPTEKTIWTREQGYQEYNIDLGNAVFLFCTSSPPVNLGHMRKNFGEYIVKIGEPQKLAGDIYDYFVSTGHKFIISGCKVVYNKGQKLDRELEKNERLDYSFKQKPESFKPDCEFRIVAIKLEGQCKHECKYLDGELLLECQYIEVKINKRLGYAHLI